MTDRTDEEMRNIVRDAHQWIDAVVKDPTKTRDDAVEVIECMQEVVQDHLDQKQSDHFYSELKRLLDERHTQK